MGGDDCARHNFGIEVLAENADGSLTRHILTEDRLTPAIIDKVRAGNRGQLFCDLAPLDNDPGVSGIICPPMAGLEPGTIILLSGKQRPGGKRRPAGSLCDILPGLKKNRIFESREATSDNDLNLHVVRDGNRLRLFFPESNHRRAITLYHFSTKLFEKGRRFIGDVLPEDHNFQAPPAGESIPLKTVTCARNLILLRLNETSPVFGNRSELWLRPVIIDGRERYLFYGGGVNCHPREF